MMAKGRSRLSATEVTLEVGVGAQLVCLACEVPVGKVGRSTALHLRHLG